MRLRVFLTLLMAFTNLISSVSLAQMQWGYGAYGGMQACQGMSMASGASDEEDESAELRQERYDLRKEKKELERSFRRLEADLEKARGAIAGVVQPAWSDLILEHMDNKFNCGLCETRRMTTTTTVIRVAPPVDERPPQIPTQPMPVAAPPRDTTDRTTVIELPSAPPVPVKPPKPVRAPPKVQRPAEQPQIKPGQIDPNASIVTPNNSRMPAATEVPAKVSAQFSNSPERPRVAPVEESLGPGDVLIEAPVDKWGSDKDFSSGGWASDGSPTLCRDRVEPYTLKKWSAICRRDGGRIERLVCTHRGFQRGAKLAPREVNDCAKSVDRYPKLVSDMEKAQARLAQIDIEIDRIGDELKDIKLAERENRAMEADCPDGRCAEGSRGRRRESRGPTLGQAFLSMMPSLLGAGAVYAVGKDANKRNERTGNMATPLAPYVAQALMGYPYGVAGQYGGTYGGVNGAFGCSPSVGGMQMGPNGMMMMPGMNPYGQVGGAFGYPQAMMQGYPMGGAMYNPGAGPWGVNGPWGVGAWPGGYPGNGVLAGQFAGALAAFPGGIPYPGAYPGAYPGQIPGYNPNAAFAGQLASFPGQIPGMPYPGAYPGYPQYPGQYPGQIPGQIPGMYPGAFPGQYQGQYPGLYPGGYPQTGFAGMPDPNLVNRQIEQQRSELMRYQSFIQEYSSFTSKWQQYFGGGAGGGTTTYRNDYYYTQPSGPTTNTGTGRTR